MREKGREKRRERETERERERERKREIGREREREFVYWFPLFWVCFLFFGSVFSFQIKVLNSQFVDRFPQKN